MERLRHFCIHYSCSASISDAALVLESARPEGDTAKCSNTSVATTKRTLEFSMLERRTDGHGGTVWDASLCLACYLAHDAIKLVKSRRVLEIGAGCGLPGLAGCMLGADVSITDKPQLQSLLQENIAMNCNPLSSDADAYGRCEAAVLEFGQNLTKRLPAHLRPPYDVVLASDILGCADSGVFRSIVKTFTDIAKLNEKTVFLMSYRHRAEWEDEFFEMLGEAGFRIDEKRRFTCRYVDPTCSAVSASSQLSSSSSAAAATAASLSSVLTGADAASRATVNTGRSFELVIDAACDEIQCGEDIHGEDIVVYEITLGDVAAVAAQVVAAGAGASHPDEQQRSYAGNSGSASLT